MKYDNLNHLISHSSSSRHYFLSLPIELQIELHKYNDSIDCLQQLHQYVYALKHRK